MNMLLRPTRIAAYGRCTVSKTNLIKVSKFFLPVIAAIIMAQTSAVGQSGSALSFDALDDHVTLPNILPSGSYTKEAWIFGNSFAGFNSNIVSGSQIAFWVPNGSLSAGHNGSYFAVQDVATLSTGVWYHVAVTYNVATDVMSLYKNGVLVGSGDADGGPGSDFTETVQFIGAFDGGGGPGNLWDGIIDEVRVWSTPLTQGEIRDWMCRSVTASHPQIGSLVAYYKCDDGAGTNLDDSQNTNDGTLVNGVAWVTSGASIGSASAHDYVNVTKTVNLAAPSGENLTATEASGTPDGIHVYRVDAVPNSTTGIAGLGSNDRYFGVFVAGGTAPTYDVVYDYTGNPGVDPFNEPDLLLFKRGNNSVTTWVDAGATLNTAANTLTALGESTEYILGSSGSSLPVTFSSFTATKERNGVRLDWSTATESNNAGFEIQQSENGVSWKKIGFISGAGNSAIERFYSYVHATPARGINYYRLKQIDLDNNFKYSEVKSVRFGNLITLVYPVPTKDFVILDLKDNSLIGSAAVITDLQGRLVQKTVISKMQQQISLARLNAGIYFLRLEDGETYKLIKQ